MPTASAWRWTVCLGLLAAAGGELTTADAAGERRAARRARAAAARPLVIDPATGQPLPDFATPASPDFNFAPGGIVPTDGRDGVIPPSADAPAPFDPEAARDGMQAGPVPDARPPRTAARNRRNPEGGRPIPIGPMPLGPVPDMVPLPLAEPAPAPLGPVTEGPYQFYLVARQDFLNRFVERTQTTPTPVRDFVLGADVYGQQTTTSNVRLQIVPGATMAKAQFVIHGSGEVKSTGVTPQASVNTRGQQIFRGTKDVMFDGEKLSTRAAVIAAQAQNVPVSAVTAVSDRPLIGPIAERIALREASRLRPQAEALARDRVADQVFANFNTEVDEQLAGANRQLFAQREKLQAMNLLPSAQQWSSTTGALQWAALFGGRDPAGTSFPPPAPELRESHGLSLYVHESLLNQAVDRAGLAGKVTTDRELKAIGQRMTSLLPGADVEPSKAAPERKIETQIEFDRADPLRFTLEGGELVATIKATFRPAGQSLLPPMTVRIPLRLELAESKARFIRGPVTVRADADARTTQIAFAETLVRQSIEGNLPEIEFPRQLPAAYWTYPGPAPTLTSAQSGQGWLVLGID